jgi:FPC/CPF motif-containing protein YcgG
MKEIETNSIIDEYFDYLKHKEYPCIGAKATLARQQIKCMLGGHMSCPRDDRAILKFLYSFVDDYRKSLNFYHSATIIFTAPEFTDEKMFDELMWQRLQALSDLDAENYNYDKRVVADPSSPNFSFSLKEEAFYIIGLHASSSRRARQFKYPSLVFNPHAQFEQLRKTSRYQTMKNVVRKRDIAYSGSVNPMLEDFGTSSEVYQYSGRQYDDSWQCPLKINHAANKNNSAS